MNLKSITAPRVRISLLAGLLAIGYAYGAMGQTNPRTFSRPDIRRPYKSVSCESRFCIYPSVFTQNGFVAGAKCAYSGTGLAGSWCSCIAPTRGTGRVRLVICAPGDSDAG